MRLSDMENHIVHILVERELHPARNLSEQQVAGGAR